MIFVLVFEEDGYFYSGLFASENVEKLSTSVAAMEQGLPLRNLMHNPCMRGVQMIWWLG